LLFLLSILKDTHFEIKIETKKLENFFFLNYFHELFKLSHRKYKILLKIYKLLLLFSTSKPSEKQPPLLSISLNQLLNEEKNQSTPQAS
jgi:hypothetical protein